MAYKKVTINFKDFQKVLKASKRSGVKLNVKFEVNTLRQVAALETLNRHPTNTRGIATALYGSKEPLFVDRAGAVLRRLRKQGATLRDENGIWHLTR